MRHFTKAIEHFSLQITPACFTLLLFFISLALSHITGFSALVPDLTTISIYGSVIFFPQALSYPFLFLLGIADDSVRAMPLGIHSLSYMILKYILLRNHRFFQDAAFSFIWIIFILLFVCMSLTTSLIMNLYYFHLVIPAIAFLPLLSTAFAYPIVHYLLASIYTLKR